ncbi:MAG TPA: flagellar protein FlaG [Telluria sp.]
MLVSTTSGSTAVPSEVRSVSGLRQERTQTEATRAPAPIALKPEAPEQDQDRLDPDQAVAKLNEFTSMVAQGLQFSIDEDSGRTLVKVIDTSTQEVLRQFPTKEALSLARAIGKMQGLLIQDKA